MSTRINVITITYNDLEGLKETIKSVDEQSHENILHIIIDGGTPNFHEITRIERVKDSIYISELDNGIYDAMNKGISYCKEGIVCWLNSADIYEKDDILENVVKSYSTKHWKWAYGAMKFRNSPETKGEIFWQYPFNSLLLSLGLRWIPHPASFFDLNLVLRLKKYDESIEIASDQEFILRASKISLPDYLPFTCVEMKPGGAHSSLNGLKRERIWQNIRRKDGFLLFNSIYVDNLFVRLSPLITKVFYLHRDTLNRRNIDRHLKANSIKIRE